MEAGPRPINNAHESIIQTVLLFFFVFGVLVPTALVDNLTGNGVLSAGFHVSTNISMREQCTHPLLYMPCKLLLGMLLNQPHGTIVK